MLQADFLPDLRDDGADILDRIAKGANRMRLMLDSLLQYSRYNSSAIAGKTAKLEDVVRDALSAFDTEALGVKVDAALNGADDVRGDPILLSHVLQNLIGNAVKFRSPIAPAITVEAYRSDRKSASLSPTTASASNRGSPKRSSRCSIGSMTRMPMREPASV